MISRTGLLVLIGIVVCSGCGVFRGIPTHGGGKRFDEEQRIVSGAIRRALADMDLGELKDKRVQIVLECIAQDGGGNVTWPGLQSITMGGSLGRNLYDYRLLDPNLRNNQNQSYTVNTGNVNAQAAIQAYPNLYSNVFSTQPDLAYLKAALEMKVRHADIVLAADRIDAILYVLVDVLGTNRSRKDAFFSVTEEYQATCEMTYYAQAFETNKLIFRQRQVSAVASYDEQHPLGIAKANISRSAVSVTPMIPSVDSAAAPRKAKFPAADSQPAAATPAAPPTPPAPVQAATTPPPPAPVAPAPAALLAPATQPVAPPPATMPTSAPAA